ncbi:hypothetical protein HPB47_018347, partial [Ixodes persulcatus]
LVWFLKVLHVRHHVPAFTYLLYSMRPTTHPVASSALDYGQDAQALARERLIRRAVWHVPAKHDAASYMRATRPTPSSVAALDRRLLLIKPPHCFTRLPRSLGTRGNWKASEWRHWLLYYCLPCTQGILPLRYWSHLAKLVEGIHLLLREELTPSSIDQAETLLLAFVASTRILYKDLVMTFNVHQLLHLAEAERQMGPLWGHSAFVFVSGNGHLVKLVTGENAVPSQIVERVVMEPHLECLLTSLLLSDSCKEKCNRMLGYPKLLNFMSVGEVGLLGCPHKLVLSEQVKSALSEYVDECPDLAAEYT